MSSSLLFADDPRPTPPGPLADRMRPKRLDEVVGQAHLLAAASPLRAAIDRDHLHSFLLWGPPGTGKTTIARLVADASRAQFTPLSAVTAGIKDLKEAVAAADRRWHMTNVRTILFVDEIHRFNKAQQDALLPHVESGTVVLVGATTENPSFEVNAALLSRLKVYVLHPLTTDDIAGLLGRALTDPDRGLGRLNIGAEPAALTALAVYANGDARAALNTLEQAAHVLSPDATGARLLDRAGLASLLQRRTLVYDKSGEEHYNLISALHKSVRNSDADAAVYWLARMLEAGEDPLYVARRLVRMASEDIGNADPHALQTALAAKDAAHFLGMPECNTALAQAVTYLSAAPKSDAVYRAYQAAAADATRDLAEPVPMQIRNAPTALMKELGYGEGYRSAHDDPSAVAALDCLPPHLSGRRYYVPSDRGTEVRIGDVLDLARKLRDRARS